MHTVPALRLAVTLALLAAAPSSPAQTNDPAQTNAPAQKRWVYAPGNLYVDATLPRLEQLFRRAKAAGYSGVLFTDYKTGFWWKLDSPERWERNAHALRTLTSDLGLELVVCVFPFGRAGSLLYHDVNLASGMPVRDAPLVARGGRLVPEQTAAIANGDFEDYRGDTARHYQFQDDPGPGSCIDTQVFHHGRAALRFQDTGKVNAYGNARICQRVAVRPWQQYRLRVWMKTEGLTADDVRLMVREGGRTLQFQQLQARVGSAPQYIGAVRDLTTDWVEQSVTFNSLEFTNVNVFAGLWGGQRGRIWWDDLRIDAVPTLNVLRRDSLPVTLTAEDGTRFEEGRDFERLVDPQLGSVPWPGEYDTRHAPPAIVLPAGSRIAEGQRVRLSCYHTALVYDGQVNGSMADPAVFACAAEEVRHARAALAPDGYFMSHDEIRCAGWEPVETNGYRTSGALFAENLRRCTAIARTEGGGQPVYVWSDMFDPNHNARGDYYLVNNTIAGSWEGLDPGVIVMKWGGGGLGRVGLEHFAQRGNAQMIAAYYDHDVGGDRQSWSAATNGIPGIVGVMYTTWENNYADLEAFAKAWW